MSTSNKFEVIHETLKENDNMLNVSLLCEIAGAAGQGRF